MYWVGLSGVLEEKGSLGLAPYLISVKRNLKIEANVLVSECMLYVTVLSLIKFCVITCILYTISVCLNTKNTPLVTALCGLWRLQKLLGVGLTPDYFSTV